ncbi:MAG: hypothetical protein IIA07_11245 [Proteobacteria bacterium]|nr:hypothetical protein [Pseudomonadota bacterium]
MYWTEILTAVALLLVIEGMLPFPIEETYTDWQVLRTSFSSKGILDFFFASARHGEVDPYVDAAESAGLGVVAVEPITLSIARGLRIQEGSGVTYIALIHPDALLAAGVDAQGEVRLFHHRSLPAFVETDDQTSEGGRRAERIITELTSFLRFFRGEIGGEEQELIIDGVLDEITLQSLSGLGERLGLSVRFENETHLLSRAAARGVALRALLPRRDDHLASLMKVGTEAAYAARQMTFFMRASLKHSSGELLWLHCFSLAPLGS